MIDRPGIRIALLICAAVPSALAGLTPSSAPNLQPAGGQEDPDEDAALPEPASLTLFQEIVFYDMYAGKVDEPLETGVLRHDNTLYGTRLSQRDLASLQNTLTAYVWIGPLCDNYDRLAGLFLSLVPKGSKTYSPASVERIEITPFMDMNSTAEPVPYEFQLDNLVPLLKDEALASTYDFWVEFNVSGVPYAANKEIAGCGGRNDVFWGILEF